MKAIVLSVIAASAFTTIAHAADLPQQQPQYPAPAPVVVNPAYNWSGFYIGAMGGYGWSNNATVGGITVTNVDMKGGFVGGTIGGNYQAGQLVVGIEGDGAWSDVNRTETDFILGVPVTLQDKIQAFGSVTGRLGFAAQNVLVYGKGGYGWMNNQISGSAFGLTLAESHFHSGWTAGGGVEIAFAGPWSAKVEYMYAQYFNESYLTSFYPGGISLATNVNTVKVGVNYRFGLTPAPVTARY
jgi:outer membrane immunogenic protein